MQIDYTYADIRKWLQHFRTLDYTKTKNRKALIDTFIYRVVLYDDKMKVLFNLKSGQKNELLLNLIFPDYPDFGGSADGGESENGAKEKETDNSVSLSGCSYTPVMVRLPGLEPGWSPIRPSNVRVCLFRHNRKYLLDYNITNIGCLSRDFYLLFNVLYSYTYLAILIKYIYICYNIYIINQINI